MTANMTSQMVLGCIYGSNKGYHLVHDIGLLVADRYGIKIDMTLRDGTRIIGRLSMGRRFNGIVQARGQERKYRSKGPTYRQSSPRTFNAKLYR